MSIEDIFDEEFDRRHKLQYFKSEDYQIQKEDNIFWRNRPVHEITCQCRARCSSCGVDFCYKVSGPKSGRTCCYDDSRRRYNGICHYCIKNRRTTNCCNGDDE